MWEWIAANTVPVVIVVSGFGCFAMGWIAGSKAHRPAYDPRRDTDMVFGCSGPRE